MQLINVFSCERPINPPDYECRVVYQCSECGEPIYEGEEFTELNGNHYCHHCVAMNTDVAEIYDEEEW